MNKMVASEILQLTLARRNKYLKLEGFAMERFRGGDMSTASRATCYRKIADAIGRLYLDLGGDPEDLNTEGDDDLVLAEEG